MKGTAWLSSLPYGGSEMFLTQHSLTLVPEEYLTGDSPKLGGHCGARGQRKVTGIPRKAGGPAVCIPVSTDSYQSIYTLNKWT